MKVGGLFFMQKKIHLTKEGYEKLKKEYEELKNVKRPAAVERLQKARSMGDLSENSEYTAAREELNFIDGRIAELEAVLNQAEIVEKEKGEGVQLGDKVLLEVEGKELGILLVGEFEADPMKNKFSIDSPLGQALIGRKEGEEVKVSTPAGEKIYKVKKVIKS